MAQDFEDVNIIKMLISERFGGTEMLAYLNGIVSAIPEGRRILAYIAIENAPDDYGHIIHYDINGRKFYTETLIDPKKSVDGLIEFLKKIGYNVDARFNDIDAMRQRA